MAPAALRSPAVTGFLSRVRPTMIRPSARLEVRQVGGQAEDGHDLAARHDDEAVLPRRPAVEAAEADDDGRSARSFMSMVRGQVIRRGVDPERVALVEVVVEHAPTGGCAPR